MAQDMRNGALGAIAPTFYLRNMFSALLIQKDFYKQQMAGFSQEIIWGAWDQLLWGEVNSCYFCTRLDPLLTKIDIG